MQNALTEQEVQSRVAVLKRFKELLLAQREKFQSYLTILDHQKNDIETGDVDKLVKHVELEENIVSEIFTFQKVIEPLEDIYKMAYSAQEPSDIPHLKNTLDHLKEQVLEKNKENRMLLKQRMTIIRNEMINLRNPAKKSNQIYSNDKGGNMIDISG